MSEEKWKYGDPCPNCGSKMVTSCSCCEMPWCPFCDRHVDIRTMTEKSGIDVYCDLLELVAAHEHEQWIHWTKYMLDNLSPENIERWRKQIETPYSELSRKEQESDIVWARKVLEICYKHDNSTVEGRCWRDMEKKCPLSSCCYDASCKAVFDYWKFANSDKWKKMLAKELMKQTFDELHRLRNQEKIFSKSCSACPTFPLLQRLYTPNGSCNDCACPHCPYKKKSAYQQIDDLFYKNGLKGKIEFVQMLEKIKVILRSQKKEKSCDE